MKRILITHAFGPDNRGDHELLIKLMSVLRHKYGENSHFTVFTSFPEKSASTILEDNIVFYKSPISLAGIKKTFKVYLKLFLTVIGYLFYILTKSTIFLSKEDKQKIKIIESVDLVFYCPGGYLFSNGNSFYANVINGLILKHTKAPIYFSPMSIGPFYTKFDQNLCKRLLKTATKIFVRESYSFNLLQEYGVKNVWHTTDLAWYNSSIEKYKTDLSWKDHFVITVIDWNYSDVGQSEYYRNRYFEEIILCCKKLYSFQEKKVILYNQVGTGKGDSKDEMLIRKIAQAIPHIVQFDGEELDPETLKSRLSYCQGLVASRFHSALFAIQANAPFISLSYQPKAEFILKDLELDDLCRRIYQFDGEEVAEKLIQLSLDKVGFSNRLARVKGISQDLLEQNFINQI